MTKQTVDWRAGCEKFACPVRREGWGNHSPFLPLFPAREQAVCGVALGKIRKYIKG